MTDKPVPKGPAGPESGEDVVAATALFKQWQVYKSIIDHDCMQHREIHAAIRAYVKACYPQRFSLLDLGCGDAGGISHTFMGTPLARYTGVDASAAALQEALRQLVAAPFDVALIETDLLGYLTVAANRDAPRSDLILTGYVVHHLSVDEKQRFFTRCREALAPAGSLVFYDLFRRPGETRDQFVAAYTGLITTRWGLVGEAFDNTCRHVREHDFPETLATISAIARDAGFAKPGVELFVDAEGFHRLLCFAT
jgi:cyclopropane fatty-acyl-phospholipid synthase-like methyltransferase